MSITKKYLTLNRTYTARKLEIKPQYIVVHSTACGYISKDNLFNSWNNSTVEKSCHGMVDNNGSYLTLPLNYRGWHVGGTGNASTVGFEICEPRNVAYTTAAHNTIDKTKYNPNNADNRADFMRRYDNAVELAAYMSKETGIPVDRIICHAEAHKLGLASNHADVNHWFPLFGKSMDNFRADVRAKLAADNKPSANPSANPSAETLYKVVGGDTLIKIAAKFDTTYQIIANYNGIAKPYTIRVGQIIKIPATGAATATKYYRVQTGAFSNKTNAVAMQGKLKAKGFNAIIAHEGNYYRVQTGAFSNKTNAVAMQGKLKAKGFNAIIKEY